PAAVMFTGILNKQLLKEGEAYTLWNTEPIRADPKKYYTPECQKLARERIARIKGPILIIQGALPRIDGPNKKSRITGVNQLNAEITIPELRAAEKTLEVKTYKGEPHSFAFDSAPERTTRPAVVHKAFEDVNGFLQKHLPTKATPIDPKLVLQV